MSVSGAVTSASNINMDCGVVDLVGFKRDCLIVTTKITTPHTLIQRQAVGSSKIILMSDVVLVGELLVFGGTIAGGNNVACDCAPNLSLGESAICPSTAWEFIMVPASLWLQFPPSISLAKFL